MLLVYLSFSLCVSSTERYKVFLLFLKISVCVFLTMSDFTCSDLCPVFHILLLYLLLYGLVCLE